MCLWAITNILRCEIPDGIVDPHLRSECHRMKKAYQRVVISCLFKNMVQLHSVSARLHAELEDVGMLLAVFINFADHSRQNAKNEGSSRTFVSRRGARLTPNLESRNQLYEDMYRSIEFQCRCVMECSASVSRIISFRLRFHEKLHTYKLAVPFGCLSVREKKKSARKFSRPASRQKQLLGHLSIEHNQSINCDSLRTYNLFNNEFIHQR